MVKPRRENERASWEALESMGNGIVADASERGDAATVGEKALKLKRMLGKMELPIYIQKRC